MKIGWVKGNILRGQALTQERRMMGKCDSSTKSKNDTLAE